MHISFIKRKKNMKTKIIIGCLLAVCMLAILPSISVVEAQNIKTVNKTELLKQMREMTPQQIKKLITEKLGTTETTGLLTVALTLLISLIALLPVLLALIWAILI